MPYIHPLFSRRFDGSPTISTVLDGLDAFLRDLDQSDDPNWSRGYGPYEAVQSDTAYTYIITLPGFKRDQVTVQVQEGHDGPYIAISAQRGGFLKVWSQTNPDGSAGKDKHVEHVITLPTDADPTKVAAKLEDGILTVTVAKVAKPTPPAPRKVTVS